MFVMFSLPLLKVSGFQAECKKRKMPGMGLCLFQSFRLLVVSRLNLINRTQDLESSVYTI